jgi:hypothetical protein
VEEKICSVTAASQQFLQRETEYVAFCNVSDEDRNASVVRYLGEVSTATQGPPIIRVLAINATAGSLVITVSLDINGSVWCGAVHDEGEMTVYPSAEKLIQLGSPPADPQETDPGERSILLEGTVDWFDYFTRGRTYQVTCASEGMGPPYGGDGVNTYLSSSEDIRKFARPVSTAAEGPPIVRIMEIIPEPTLVHVAVRAEFDHGTKVFCAAVGQRAQGFFNSSDYPLFQDMLKNGFDPVESIESSGWTKPATASRRA